VVWKKRAVCDAFCVDSRKGEKNTQIDRDGGVLPKYDRRGERPTIKRTSKAESAGCFL